MIVVFEGLAIVTNTNPTRLDEFIGARGVSKYYHQGIADEVRALQNVSLAVPRGAFCFSWRCSFWG